MATYASVQTMKKIKELEKAKQEAAKMLGKVMVSFGVTAKEMALILRAMAKNIETHTEEWAVKVKPVQGAIHNNPMGQIVRLVPGLSAPADHTYCPDCGHREPIWAALVIHLNDQHRWSRQAILQWLESRGVDLTVDPEARKEVNNVHTGITEWYDGVILQDSIEFGVTYPDDGGAGAANPDPDA